MAGDPARGFYVPGSYAHYAWMAAIGVTLVLSTTTEYRWSILVSIGGYIGWLGYFAILARRMSYGPDDGRARKNR